MNHEQISISVLQFFDFGSFNNCQSEVFQIPRIILYIDSSVTSQSGDEMNWTTYTQSR